MLKRDYVVVGINRSTPPPNETLSLTLTPEPEEPAVPSMSIVLRRQDYEALGKPWIGQKVTLTLTVVAEKSSAARQ